MSRALAKALAREAASALLTGLATKVGENLATWILRPRADVSEQASPETRCESEDKQVTR
jgi:hypothetical protein